MYTIYLDTYFNMYSRQLFIYTHTYKVKFIVVHVKQEEIVIVEKVNDVG
jgi:hypothetical protein